MEIFNSRRFLGLTPTVIMSLGVLFSACSSDYEHESDSKTDLQDESDYVLKLSNGESLILSDTTIYELEFNDSLLADMSVESFNIWDDATTTRAESNTYMAYGYDTEEPESDWRTYSLGASWQQYGVTPGLYIGRYIRVHKNLSILPNTDVITASDTDTIAPKNAMGWLGTTQTLGFSTTITSDYIADGVTRVFYINCNTAGIVFNRYIPANPSNFIWGYVLREKESIWN